MVSDNEELDCKYLQAYKIELLEYSPVDYIIIYHNCPQQFLMNILVMILMMMWSSHLTVLILSFVLQLLYIIYIIIAEWLFFNISDLWSGYMNSGNPDKVCPHCKSQMWNAERNNKSTKYKDPTFSMCCRNGQVVLPPERKPPISN